MELDSLNFNLESLNEEDIINLLKRQKQLVESNYKNYKGYLQKYKAKESLLNEVLKTYLNKLAEYKNDFDFINSVHKNNALFHSVDKNKLNDCILQEKSAENCNEKCRVLPPDICSTFSTMHWLNGSSDPYRK